MSLSTHNTRRPAVGSFQKLILAATGLALFGGNIMAENAADGPMEELIEGDTASA